MTKRDFEAIAQALARTRPSPISVKAMWTQWYITRDAIATALLASNERFDEARFNRATEA